MGAAPSGLLSNPPSIAALKSAAISTAPCYYFPFWCWWNLHGIMVSIHEPPQLDH